MKRSPIRRVGKRQAARNRNLRAIKEARCRVRLTLDGYVACEGPCGRQIRDLEDAMALLDLHHKRKRSLGGTDDPSNLSLLCRRCHSEVHGQ